MKIQWLGHSCFLLTSKRGVRLLTDPFNDTVGYPLPEVEADIVTISHHHFDHDHIQVVQGDFRVVDKAGEHREKGIDILGLATFHDDQKGSKRGQNIVYRLTIDGMNIVHCGDLGHPLSAQQVEELGLVDILLVPVGGHFTIDARQALEVMRALTPSLTIPMHFKTPLIDFPIQPVEAFLQEAGGGRRIGSTEMEVDPQALSQARGVAVLDYPS